MGPATWQMCEVDTITPPTDCIKIEYAETETEPGSGKKSREPNRPLLILVGNSNEDDPRIGLRLRKMSKSEERF
jgi:hypothetical protein